LSKPYEPPIPPKPLPIDQKWALLGNRSPQEFMKEFWHKKPLLVRAAIPAFGLAALDSPISADTLFKLSQSEDCEARLVRSKPWSLDTGPLGKKKFTPPGRSQLDPLTARYGGNASSLRQGAVMVSVYTRCAAR